jgi:hypothetical protein
MFGNIQKKYNYPNWDGFEDLDPLKESITSRGIPLECF